MIMHTIDGYVFNGKIVRVIVTREEGEFPFNFELQAWNGQEWVTVTRGWAEQYYDDAKDEAYYMLDCARHGDYDDDLAAVKMVK